MGDMIRNGLTWLGAALKAHASSPVIYKRGETGKEVNAILGRTPYEVSDENGITMRAQAVDFLILVADLGFTPEPRDVIIDGGKKYEVMPLGTERCWRWSDPPVNAMLRIHTKYVGEEN